MEQVIINDAQTRRLTLMWWALALFMLLPIVGYWIQPIYSMCCVLSWCLIPVVLWGALSSLSPQTQRFTPTGRALAYLIVLITIFMYLYIGKDLLTFQYYISEYTILPYTSCLLFFLPAMPLLRAFFKVDYTLAILGCIFAIIPLAVYTDNGHFQFIFETCTLCAGFVFISGKYHSSKHLLWATACLLVGLLAATIYGRRNLMLSIALYLLIGGIQFVFGNKIKSSANRFLLLASLVVMGFAAILFYIINSHGLFSVITDRATENTRDYVFLNFALDMDLQTLLVGRGLNGTYYCPGVDGESGSAEVRADIENGYLQLILKGGALYLISYLTIFIYAIVRGFKSRNQLLHTCAWLLVVQLIDMLPFGLHAFNVKTYMLWMAVALCLDRTLWDKEDDEIQSFLTEPNLKLPQWKEAAPDNRVQSF